MFQHNSAPQYNSYPSDVTSPGPYQRPGIMKPQQFAGSVGGTNPPSPEQADAPKLVPDQQPRKSAQSRTL
jgi:hypothetical protein